MFSLIIFAFVQSTLASTDSTCPDVKPVENFDMSAFGSGVWYEIARYPNPFETLSTCVSAEYYCHNDIVNLKIRNVPFRSMYFLEAIMVFAPNAAPKGKFDFFIKHGWPVSQFNSSFDALAIDYDRYGIYYSCNTDKITGMQMEFAWIFARKSKLEDDVKKEIDNVIKKNDFIDTTKFIWIDHSDAVCKSGSPLGSLD